MNTHLHKLSEKTKRVITLALIVVLGVSSVSAGLLFTVGSGITCAGWHFVSYDGISGVTPTALDGLLAFTPNGITAPATSGVSMIGSDALTYICGLINILGTRVDRATTGQASALGFTSPNGLIINSGGNSYQADSVSIQRANGIAFNGIDNLSIIGADGIAFNGIDGASILHANGIAFNGIDGLLTITGGNGIAFNGIDGQTITIPPGDLTILGANSGTATDVSNIIFSGAESIITTVYGTVSNTLSSTAGVDILGPAPTLPPGLRRLDDSLAKALDRAADDSNINAAVVYHNAVTDADIATLRQIGVLLGQRYHVLPVVTVTATKAQILQISQLQTVRALYSNRTVKILAEPGNGLTGTERVKADADLTAANGGQTVIGRNVTVAVLDTGLDSTHGDLSGRVIRNVSTVGGAGNGERSGGRYTGVAPGAKLVGVSVGALDLLSVIEGLDYILWKRQELGIKVVNCSFSADTLYDPNDPVNVATRMLIDRGVSVVFSAGNNGPGMDTLNPYAMAPWVVGVGATDEDGQLADFSSRGSSTKLTGPSLVAPGVKVVSLRATGGTLNECV